MTFLFYVAIGLLLGVVYEAGRNMNYDQGATCWLSNGIVIAFYGTIGYHLSQFAWLAHNDDGFGSGMTVFLVIIAIPFVGLPLLAVVNIIQNGGPVKPLWRPAN